MFFENKSSPILIYLKNNFILDVKINNNNPLCSVLLVFNLKHFAAFLNRFGTFFEAVLTFPKLLV